MFISTDDTKNNITANITSTTWTTVWEYTAATQEFVNIQGWINYTANSTGSRFVSIRVGENRVYLQSNMAAANNTSNNAFYSNINLKANETLILEGYQSSGTTLTSTATFYFKKISI